MTHQYESEILNKLMERDGFNIPSSVPPYEAEIRAYLINQVKQAYPKLTDYEAEWLLYNYTKHLPADFPISSVSNVTEASFENVVPFAYQTAILKGNTLVNIVNYSETFVSTSGKYLQISSLVYSPIGKPVTLINLSDKVITFQVLANGTFKKTVTINANSKTVITLSDGEEIKNIRGSQSNGWEINETSLNELKLGLMVIDGDYTNVDIPYFTGMQSVKMPVLMTTGKNLVDPSTFVERDKLTLNQDQTITMNSDTNLGTYVKIYNLKLNEGTYTYRMEVIDGSYAGGNMMILREDGTCITQFAAIGTRTFTVTEKIYSLQLYAPKGNCKLRLQIEQGSTATSYEPFKSNILTVNEEVELRGIGDVKDELNLLTGELVQRFHKTTIDENYSWTLEGENNGYLQFGTALTVKGNVAGELKGASNGLPYGTLSSEGSQEQVLVFEHEGWITQFRIMINPSRLETPDVEGFIKYITNNPLELIYAQQPTVKTVDLTTINENGKTVHFIPLEGTMNVQSSGEIIQPTFDMAVPVEATTQNLASFINLEMEE